jgi:hypothetical protein
MHVDLGKGRTAEIVDVDDMTHGVKMKVQALLPGADYAGNYYISNLQMRELLIAHVVTEWSLELPLPGGDPAKLSAVPGSAYDKLVEATEPHWKSLDFLRAGSNSSSSETNLEDTASPASSPVPEL